MLSTLKLSVRSKLLMVNICYSKLHSNIKIKIYLPIFLIIKFNLHMFMSALCISLVVSDYQL